MPVLGSLSFWQKKDSLQTPCLQDGFRMPSARDRGRVGEGYSTAGTMSASTRERGLVGMWAARAKEDN